MEELAKPAINAIKTGELKFVPERFNKIYLHWLESIRDWCISRQLWWGHRIPAYYCRDCGEVMVSKEAPHKCAKCGSTNIKQDEDVLDTWFSSALWPFSTLGWPEKTPELEYFYPTDVLVTGYDIIFFWVVRMVFSGYAHTGRSPFHTVLIHGLIRDSQGRKMSKSLGNGIDPLEVIDKYGADALRLTIITGNSPGNDMRFYWERVEANRNFANKIWNASRFIMMNLGDQAPERPDPKDLAPTDRWIISRFNTVIQEVTDNMEKYELGIAVQKIYDFIWDEFCDWYIEIVKPRLYKKEDNPAVANAALWTLRSVLIGALKLLHPYMPFITEEIFCTLQSEEESIMVSAWPLYCSDDSYPEDEEAFGHIQDAVRAIRNSRTELNVPPSKKATVYIVSEDEKVANTFEKMKEDYINLAMSNRVVIQKDKTGIDDSAVSAVIPGAVIYIPFEELVDLDKEKERLAKERDRLMSEINRAKGMLANEKFVSKAPEAKVKEEKDKLAKYEEMLSQVEQRISQLS